MNKQTTLLVLIVVSLLLGPTFPAPASGAETSRDLADRGYNAAEGYDGGQPHGVKSAAIKKALRTLSGMLRSKKLDKVLSWLQDEAGLRVVGVVRKHARTIADTLDGLVKWEQITMQIVRDQIAGALKMVKVPDSVATETAFWIEQFISWTLL